MSIGSFISKLKDVNDSNLVEVFVPSAGKLMKFRQLTVKQQKDLIKTGLDGIISGLTFSNAVSDVILDNTVEKYDFLVTDKVPIILSLRKESFGTKVTLTENDKKISFELDNILNKTLKYSMEYTMTLQLENTELIVDIAVPSILNDKKINELHIVELKKHKSEDMPDTVASLFLYEIAKFITKLKIEDELVDLTIESIKDRIILVEKLPSTLNNSILQYISSFRKLETEYLTQDDNVLSLDARLFAKD